MGKIKLNGNDFEIEGPVSVADLLVKSNIEKKSNVSVQLNGEFVDHAHFNTINTNHGDTVIFMYFINGGSYPHQVRYR